MDSKDDKTTPKDLPVFGDKEVETHTMQQDLQKDSGDLKDGTGMLAPDDTQAPKSQIPTPPKPPFSPQIPPMKKSSMFDKFRKPKSAAPDISNVETFKDMVPKATTDGDETKIDIPKPAPETKEETEWKPSVPQQKLDIKIPDQASKLPMIITFVIVVLVIASIAGFAYYWFFMKTPAPTTTPEETTQPEVVEIPEPVVEEPVVKEPIVEEPVVTIPEPEVPESTLNFTQTIITTSNQRSQTEFINNLRADSRSIVGDGTVTRHLLKVSNEQEKTFLLNRELLNTLNLSVPSNVLANITSLELISYKIDNSVRYGLIANINNKEAVLANTKAWGLQSLQDLKQLFMGEPITIPENPTFAENTYLEFDKRYINLLTPEISLDFAVSDDYLIVATSKDMVMAAILQTQ